MHQMKSCGAHLAATASAPVRRIWFPGQRMGRRNGPEKVSLQTKEGVGLRSDWGRRGRGGGVQQRLLSRMGTSGHWSVTRKKSLYRLTPSARAG